MRNALRLAVELAEKRRRAADFGPARLAALDFPSHCRRPETLPRIAERSPGMRFRAYSLLLLPLAALSLAAAGMVASAGLFVAAPPVVSVLPPTSPTLPSPSATLTRPDRQIRLQATGNRLGRLRACNCAGPQGNATDRERILVRSFESDSVPLVRVDAGGFVNPDPTDVARIQTAYLFPAFPLLHLDAINVTADDLDVGVETLLEAGDRYSLPFVSANLARADSNELLFPAYRIVEARDAGGRRVARVGILGVSPAVPPTYPVGVVPRKGLPGYGEASFPSVPLSPGRSFPRDYRTLPPRESLEREVDRLRPRCDVLIVLTRLASEGARNLIRGIPGIDIVVAGAEVAPDFGVASSPAGSPRLVAPGIQSREMVELLITLNESVGIERAKGRIHELALQGAFDPDVAALALAEEKAEALGEPLAEGVHGKGNGLEAFAGIDICRDCHFAEARAWASSRHARAFEDLALCRAVREPLCLSCHSTGFGQAGGFDSREETPGLAGVQCESCHGPAGAHVAWAYRDWRRQFRGLRPDDAKPPAAGKSASPPSGGVPILPSRPMIDRCDSCHSRLSDPAFPRERARQGFDPSRRRQFSHDLSSFE